MRKILTNSDVRYGDIPEKVSRPVRRRSFDANSQMLTAYLEDGRSLQSIGDEHGICRERVRQILSQFEEYRTYRERVRRNYRK